MIVITGGLGFIGSALVKELNDRGIDDILIVDNFRSGDKWLNVRGLRYDAVMSPLEFASEEQIEIWQYIDQVFHMGACSSTTEQDMDFLWDNNVNFSKTVFLLCAEFNVPLCYASSAATYGAGEQGYNDSHKEAIDLRPLNKYGYSKQVFDLWALAQIETPPRWYGMKFFNVYGPNEYHKDSMRSVVHQAHEQICENGEVKLFKSHKKEYKDGEQMRDFVYVKDVCRAMADLLLGQEKAENGLYNMGTGQKRSFKDLAQAVFKAMDKAEKISFFDMPEVLRGKYQYSTEANMKKFGKALPQFKFMSLEEGVSDYVQNHLMQDNQYLETRS